MTKDEFSTRFSKEIYTQEGAVCGTFHDYVEHAWTKYTITVLCKPTSVCEIGVKCGYSGWAFIQAIHSASSYFGIDPYVAGYNDWSQEQMELHKQNASRLPGGANLIFKCCEDLPALPVADFYHIDGNHAETAVNRDLEKVMHSAAGRPFILLDDGKRSPVVKAVRTFLQSHPEYTSLSIASWRGEMLLVPIT